MKLNTRSVECKEQKKPNKTNEEKKNEMEICARCTHIRRDRIQTGKQSYGLPQNKRINNNVLESFVFVDFREVINHLKTMNRCDCHAQLQ